MFENVLDFPLFIVYNGSINKSVGIHTRSKVLEIGER
jgi:hypothetical protein